MTTDIENKDEGQEENYPEEIMPEIFTKKIEAIDEKPPATTTSRLQQALSSKYNDYENMKSQVADIERKKQEEAERIAEEKRLWQEELSRRNSTHVLKCLHQVIRNPEIIKYLNEIGEILVYELDRGFGSNMLIFMKNSWDELEQEISEALAKRLALADSDKEDAPKEIKELTEKIQHMNEEMERRKKAGGSIYLYIARKEEYTELNYYSSDEKKVDESLSLLRVYFGANQVLEDAFQHFNTPEKIMEQIAANLQLDKLETTFTKVRKNLAKLKEQENL